MYKINKLVSLLTLISLFLFSACNIYETMPEDGTTITVVDGYIKNAIVVDSKGQTASYDGQNGKYSFENSPAYPIELTGGQFEATDQAFDIQMSAKNGLIISPITTFLNTNKQLRQKLTDHGFSYIKNLKGFSVDYMATGNADLAKLSQLLYVVLRQDITDDFVSELNKIDDSNNSLDDLFAMTTKVIDNSLLNDDIKEASKNLLTTVKNYNGTSNEIEKNINEEKKQLSNIDKKIRPIGEDEQKKFSVNINTSLVTNIEENKTDDIKLIATDFNGVNIINTKEQTQITVLDGYVKNANVVDALGQKATYCSKGKYTFKDTPTYPIKSFGGELEATNEPFDINMSVNDGVSLVISPITTFINNDGDIVTKLSNAGFADFNTMEDFSIDYIATGNEDLAKLAQILYVILKDNDLTTTFKAKIDSARSLDEIFVKANETVETSSISLIKKLRYKLFFKTIKNYTGIASDIESDIKIKTSKYNLNHERLNI